MRREQTKILAWGMVLCLVAIANAQTAEPAAKPKQTARQALLEMFFGQKPDAFEKHLPAAMHDFLKARPGGVSVNDLLLGVNEIRQAGREVETFDEGPVLVHAHDPRTEQNAVVAVESESDRGDEYEIRLAISPYRNGRPLPLPFAATLICMMKMDSEVWRLDDLQLKLHLPVGDPDFLTSLGQRIGAGKVEAQEGAALRGLRGIVTAEVSYAAAFPNVGFACSLSDLGGSGAAEPSPHAGMMMESGFSNAVEGYTFSVADCSGNPRNHFQIVAIPQNTEDGQRAFCEDESGKLRYAEDGEAAACLSSGQPVP